jgi:hypothetical protein
MSNNDEKNNVDYPYSDNIKSPEEIGMNDNGTMPQLGRNVNGLVAYTELLVSGKSEASRPGGPLGNKYFLKTGATCKAADTCTTDAGGVETCEDTARYIYVNNIPGGNIPFISSSAGINFMFARGLIPGTMEKLGVLNPGAIFRAFTDGSTPKCQKITMEVIDNKNIQTQQSNYVTMADIKGMDPCWFNTSTYNKKNPLTSQKCKESFQNPLQANAAANAAVVMSEDPIDQIYFAGLAGIGIYIFYRIMVKAH